MNISKCFSTVGVTLGFYVIIALNFKYNHWIGTFIAYLLSSLFVGLMDWLWVKINPHIKKDEYYQKQKESNWNLSFILSWGTFVSIVLLGFLSHSLWFKDSMKLDTEKFESLITITSEPVVSEPIPYPGDIEYTGWLLSRPKVLLNDLVNGMVPLLKYVVSEGWSLGRDVALDTNEYYSEKTTLPKRKIANTP